VARPGSPELAELAARIERGLGTPPTTTPRAGGANDQDGERAAFEAFYSGDYGGAAERFGALAASGARGRRERLLAYAACARAGAALLKGADGEPDLERARKLYAELGADASRALARDGLVSPRIVRALSQAATGAQR